MGGCRAVATGVWTSQNYVKIYGTRYKPPEGPSERPEVLCHLRRVGGVFLRHPGGSETQLAYVPVITSHRLGISLLRI